MDPQREIPPERQTLYYAGMGLSVLGVLVFVSTFFSVPSVHDSFGKFESGMHDTMATALIGMGLLVVGGILASVGRAGLAGSGLKLDPQQARTDLEPWNRAAGGMLNDTLEEVTALHPQAEEPVVKVRCSKCRALNDESSRFCGQCAAPL